MTDSENTAPVSCLHTSCSCEAEAGQSYCSDACRSGHRDGGQSACLCGHEGCKGSA